jgi:hypothetical protein
MADDAKKVIRITAEDLEKVEVKIVEEQIVKAKEIPLVREVGVSTASRDSLITVIFLTLAGLISGFAIWVTWSVLPATDDSFVANMQSSVSITLVLALLLVVADAGLSRSASKLGRSLLFAVPAAIFASLLFGLIANWAYTTLVENTYSSLIEAGLDPSGDSFYQEFANRNHLNRGLAWMVLGLSAGISVGVPSLAIRRILVTGSGGAIGGFVGGFLFDFFQGQTEAQIVGLGVLGAAIGLSVSLLEQATKSSWLEIVRGGMAGKQFILYQNQVTLGSSPAANVTLIKDPGIAAFAATIKKFGSTVSISATDRAIPISVDGVTAFEHKLKEGSVIILGSTEIRFREKSKQINNKTIVRG